jgi:CRP-like cAMP-binding protein
VVVEKQTLARIPFFKDVADFPADRFDRRCVWRKFEQGETVVDFEDESTDVYFLLSGDVRVLIRTAAGKEIILAEMKGGQFFGELAAIDGVKRSANVTALTKAEICIMPSTVFREAAHVSPAISDKIMRLLAARVRDLNARLTEHSIFDLKHRLYSELLRLSTPRAGGGTERIVSPPPFHHVLAARIGCRREQVTREFSALSQDGLIEKRRGALVLLKPDVLERRLADAMKSED